MTENVTLKISISGVRGVVGDSLTPQLAGRFASAFGTYIGPGKVIVGRDARSSGEMLENAVFAGLIAVGCQPVDIGICPIPSVLLLTKDVRARGGVVVTASHNPREWNGLKFLSRRGLYLTASEVEELLDIYHQGEFSFARADKHRPAISEPHPTRHHLARLLGSLDVGLIRGKKIRVVADCNNGAGAVLFPEFLEALGCEVTALNTTPDGTFAHQSEPVPENLTGLCRRVREAGADVGFAQDADADRLAIVDENGRFIGEEYTLALSAAFVLRHRKGKLATNLVTSRMIDDIAGAAGCQVVRAPTGEANVVEAMLREGCIFGGEGNGGSIEPRVVAVRDSLVSIAYVLQYMAETNKTVSQLVAEIPRYRMIKTKFPCSPGAAAQVAAETHKAFAGRADAQFNTIDGLRIDLPEGWVSVRASNTEPIMRIMAEARDAAVAQDLVDRVREIADAAIAKAP